MFSLFKELNYHRGGLSHILILKDGRLCSSSSDNTLIIYNSINFKPDLIIKEHSDYVNYHIQLKNENIVTCSWDNTLKIIKLLGTCKYKIIQTLKEHKFVVDKAIELENGKLLTVADDLFVILWKKNEKNNDLYEVEKKIKSSMNDYPNSNIVLMNNDLLLCTSQSDFKIRFYEINNNFQLEFYFDMIHFSFSRNSVLYIEEKDLLFVGGKENNGLYLFKLKKFPHLIGKFFGDWINEIHSIILLEEGNVLMGVHEKKKGKEGENEKSEFSICKFGINENKVILLNKAKNAHKELINGITHWKQKNLFVSCSLDSKIKLWKVNEK